MKTEHVQQIGSRVWCRYNSWTGMHDCYLMCCKNTVHSKQVPEIPETVAGLTQWLGYVNYLTCECPKQTNVCHNDLCFPSVSNVHLLESKCLRVGWDLMSTTVHLHIYRNTCLCSAYHHSSSCTWFLAYFSVKPPLFHVVLPIRKVETKLWVELDHGVSAL